MDITQRKKAIVNAVNSYGSVRIADLCDQLNVTRETVRKDINDLDQEGVIKAIRGGATISKGLGETKFEQRKKLYAKEKKEIAQKALLFIRDGDSVFLDSGTTSLGVAEAIKKSDLENITVITNSTFVISSLQFASRVQLVLLGGTVRIGEGSVSGPLTLENAQKIYADIGFFGSGGINIQSEITNPFIEEIETSKMMLKHCTLKAIVADHSKFGKNSLYKMFGLHDVDVVITDNKIKYYNISELELNNIFY